MSPASLLEVVEPEAPDEVRLAENSFDCWSSFVSSDRNRNRVVGGTESMNPVQVEWNDPISSDKLVSSTLERWLVSRLAASSPDSSFCETIRRLSRSGSELASPFFAGLAPGIGGLDLVVGAEGAA